MPSLPRVRAVIAQIHPRLGDVAANLAMHQERIATACSQGADLVMFPELSLTGYFLKDMVPSVAMRLDNPVLQELAKRSRDCAILAGFVEETPDHRFYNSAGYFEDGQLRHVHRKVYLPTYGLFDEGRYFARGDRLGAFDTKFGRAAILICEDLWHLSTAYVATLDGALTIFCPSASPLRGLSDHRAQDDNARYWENLNAVVAQTFGVSFLYANRAGFEDGIGFWGGSEVLSPLGSRLAKAAYYQEDLLFAELDGNDARRQRIAAPLLRDEDVDLTISELQRIRAKAR